MSLILASGSPRRRELMALITPNYTVAPSDVDESRITAATPAQLAQALAEYQKTVSSWPGSGRSQSPGRGAAAPR